MRNQLNANSSSNLVMEPHDIRQEGELSCSVRQRGGGDIKKMSSIFKQDQPLVCTNIVVFFLLQYQAKLYDFVNMQCIHASVVESEKTSSAYLQLVIHVKKSRIRVCCQHDLLQSLQKNLRTMAT